MKIIGERIYLRLLQPEDVGPAYVAWMQDPEVLQYLESRWSEHTEDSVCDYVRSVNSTDRNYMFGIFLKDSNQHIGNIKIGDINYIHRYGDIGLIVGDKKVWGKGYGSEAIILATKIAFEQLNLNKVIAGIYANNMGSHKAFLKAGYRELGRKKKHRFYNGTYVDEILVEKLRDEED